MALSSTDAFEMSRWFRELSVELGTYRSANRQTLTQAERDELEQAEFALLNSASEMVTRAIDLVLDESETSFDGLKSATGQAQKAVKTLNTARKVINVATAAVGLAAAVAARDPKAVGKGAQALLKAATAPA